MSIKSDGYILFIGKEDIRILSFLGHRTKVTYDSIIKIEYLYPHFPESGYISFIDQYRKSNVFSFNKKNNEQIGRAIEYIGKNRPEIEIVERTIKDIPFYENNLFISVMMIFCCFPLGLVLMWKYKKKSTFMMTMLTVAVLVLYSGGFYTQYMSTANTIREANTAFNDIYNTKNESTDYPSEPLGLSVSELEQMEADAETTDTFYVGDFYDSDEITIMFIDSGEHRVENEYSQPASGNKYIYAEFSVVNNGDADIYAGSASFTCYADNTECSQPLIGTDDSMTSFATLSTGRNVKGKIYFEVPINANNIEIEYQTDFLTQEKVYFIVE